MEIIVQTGGLMRHVGWEEGSRMLKDIGFAGVDWNLDAHVNRAAFKEGVLPKDHFFLHSPDEIKKNLDHQLQPMRALPSLYGHHAGADGPVRADV